MIDLHMHTTASDGRSTPRDLAAQVRAAGIRIMAVTDHDTTAGVAETQAAAAALGVTCHVGIEITAVEAGRDVHVLGYGVRPDDAAFQAFLSAQRDDRRRRLTAIGDRLAQLGVPVDLDRAIEDAGRLAGRAMGRPMAAAALVAAGHVASVSEAFDRYLGEGKPAFIERQGSSAAAVVAVITRAGGIASLAHPAKYRRDDLVPPLVKAGLHAIEVWHPDHDAIDTARYRQMAATFGVLATGGSDYHGVGSSREPAFGTVHLPMADYLRLAECVGWSVDDAH